MLITFDLIQFFYIHTNAFNITLKVMLVKIQQEKQINPLHILEDSLTLYNKPTQPLNVNP